MFFTTVEDFSPHAKQEKNDYICYLIVNLLLYVLVNSNAKNSNINLQYTYNELIDIEKIFFEASYEGKAQLCREGH